MLGFRGVQAVLQIQKNQEMLEYLLKWTFWVEVDYERQVVHMNGSVVCVVYHTFERQSIVPTCTPLYNIVGFRFFI